MTSCAATTTIREALESAADCGAGLAPAEMQRRYDNLAAAVAAVGRPGQETK